MRISVSRYELRPVRSLSAVAAPGPRPGALIRVEHPEGPGFADLHPWPELGDAGLGEQLRSLAEGPPLPLAARALEISRLDARARAEGKSLFDGLRVPESHALVSDILSVSATDLERLSEAGFARIKLKAGRDPRAEGKALRELAKRVRNGSAEPLFRIDFNCGAASEDLKAFAGEAGPALDLVDFVEDPMPWNPREWLELKRMTGVRLALDRAVSLAIAFRDSEAPSETPSEAFIDVLVIKPAAQDPREVPETAARLPRVYTSYLDHPLGQTRAAYEAGLAVARGEKVEVCGLRSHGAYEPNVFSELLGPPGPRWIVPSGCGLGFDASLALCHWT